MIKSFVQSSERGRQLRTELWLIQKFPLPLLEARGFFSSLLHTDLVEALEAKSTKGRQLPLAGVTLKSVQ